MEIIFLGTSSGTPTKDRNVSATAVKMRHKKSWCLIDCGEGTQHQILHTNLALNHLSAIMITHVHGDHCYGLPGLLASAAMTGRTAPMLVIAPAAIQAFIETTQKLSDTYLTYAIEFIAVESLKGPVDVGDFLVAAHRLSHRVASFAYGFNELFIENSLNIEKLNAAAIPAGPIWGQLQAGKNVEMAAGDVIAFKEFLLPARKPRKLIVGGDNDSPELLQPAMEGTDLLIHESTYTEQVSDKVGAGPQHSSAKKVALFAESSQLKNLILTHFSARYQGDTNQKPNISEIEEEAKYNYQGNLYLANDFDRFYLDKSGHVSLKN